MILLKIMWSCIFCTYVLSHTPYSIWSLWPQFVLFTAYFMGHFAYMNIRSFPFIHQSIQNIPTLQFYFEKEVISKYNICPQPDGYEPDRALKEITHCTLYNMISTDYTIYILPNAHRFDGFNIYGLTGKCLID